MRFGLFEDRKSGREYSLYLIEETAYWADKDGDLYCVNEITRQCWFIRGAEALETVLRRKNAGVVCCHKEAGALKSNAGHTDNYLKRFS